MTAIKCQAPMMWQALLHVLSHIILRITWGRQHHPYLANEEIEAYIFPVTHPLATQQVSGKSRSWTCFLFSSQRTWPMSDCLSWFFAVGKMAPLPITLFCAIRLGPQRQGTSLGSHYFSRAKFQQPLTWPLYLHSAFQPTLHVTGRLSFLKHNPIYIAPLQRSRMLAEKKSRLPSLAPRFSSLTPSPSSSLFQCLYFPFPN